MLRHVARARPILSGPSVVAVGLTIWPWIEPRESNGEKSLTAPFRLQLYKFRLRVQL